MLPGTIFGIGISLQSLCFNEGWKSSMGLEKAQKSTTFSTEMKSLTIIEPGKDFPRILEIFKSKQPTIQSKVFILKIKDVSRLRSQPTNSKASVLSTTIGHSWANWYHFLLIPDYFSPNSQKSHSQNEILQAHKYRETFRTNPIRNFWNVSNETQTQVFNVCKRM